MPKAQPDLQTRTSTLADGRIMVTRRLHASAEDVWTVLGDGRLCATWMVGPARFRGVDRRWPSVGSRLHHSSGLWPVLVDDHTQVLACDPGRELLLAAGGGWPAGGAVLRVMASAVGPHACIVRVAEDVANGIGRFIPRPARQMLIASRNQEALRRLAFIAEGHHKLDDRLSIRSTDDDEGSAWLRTS